MGGRAELVMSGTRLDIGVRLLWLLVGLLCVIVGALGIVLPLLPTTPFLLVAVFAFARSSARLHAWILAHRKFGPLINNWHQHGSIDRKSKRIAVVILIATPIISWFMGAPMWALATQVVILSMSATFILTRPLPPSEAGTE